CLLDHHLRDLYVTCRWLVEGTGNHFATHGTLHLGHFFRTFVDQQDNQAALGVVAGDRLRDVLQDEGLTGLGWRYDQSALALADRRCQVNGAGAEVFGAAVADFEAEAFSGEQRSEVFEEDLVLGILGFGEVDFGYLEQREVSFAFFRGAYLAVYRIARTQVEASNLAGRNIDVIGACQVR